MRTIPFSNLPPLSPSDENKRPKIPSGMAIQFNHPNSGINPINMIKRAEIPNIFPIMLIVLNLKSL